MKVENIEDESAEEVVDLEKLQQHPIGKLFPEIHDEEDPQLPQEKRKYGLRSMAAEIERSGLREKIVMLDGMALDGWNRVRACRLAGIELRKKDFRQYDEETEGHPLAYVLSANIQRRHLSVGQRAAVVVELQKLMPEPLKGRPAKKAADSPQLLQAAEVSERRVREYKQVEKADPELAKEVAGGKKTLHKAVKQAAKKATGTEHDDAMMRIAEVCGKSFLEAIKEEQIGGMTKANQVIEFAGFDDETMTRLLPGLRLGWSLKDARRHLEMDISPAHSIEQAIKLLLAKGEEMLEREFDGFKVLIVDLRTDEQKAAASIVAPDGKPPKKKRPQKAVPQPSIEEFVAYAKSRGIDENKAAGQWRAWDAGGWCDGKNNSILNWKNKMVTFFENEFGVVGKRQSVSKNGRKARPDRQDEFERSCRKVQSIEHVNSPDKQLHPGMRYENCATCQKEIAAKFAKIRTGG